MSTTPTELKLLLDLTQATSEAKDLDGALARVLETIRGTTGFRDGEVWLTGTDASAQEPPEWAESTRGERSPRWKATRDEVTIPILAAGDWIGAMKLHVESRTADSERLAAVITLAAAHLGAWLLRKRAEDSVRASEDRLRVLIDHVGDAVFMLASDGTIVTWSRVAERVLGYTADEALGQRPTLFYVDSEEREGFVGELAHARARGQIEVDGWRKRRDGTAFWARAITCAVRDADGKVTGYAKIVRDLTVVRLAEERARQHADDLERSNRELEEFASIASHDLQEPLRKILAFSDRLATRCTSALDEKGLHYLERLQDAARRMQTLVNDLLAYSRVASRAHPFRNVDLGAVAADVMRDLESTIEVGGGRVDIGELPKIEADETQMRQLLQNLLTNAMKFCAPGQKPAVTVSSRRIRAPIDGPPRWEIVVADNGIGFDEKYLERIFGMLQRLHGRAEYEGTGMGLAICRRIAERHRGTITARSSPGHGATFVVTLPETHAATTTKTGERSDG